MSQKEVKPDGPEVQRVLLRVRAKLRESDAELEQLCKTLPEPTEDFDAWAELRGTLECVRTDLLEDAVATLRLAARRTKEEWHNAFQQRCQLLVSGGGSGGGSGGSGGGGAAPEGIPRVFKEALLEAEILSALDEVGCEGIAAYVERAVERAEAVR